MVIQVVEFSSRRYLQKSCSTMVLHFFPKSFQNLQIPFLFISFCLSQFNHQKYTEFFLETNVLKLNCLKEPSLTFVLICCLYVTLNISKKQIKTKNINDKQCYPSFYSCINRKLLKTVKTFVFFE